MRHDAGLSITSNFFWDPSYVNPNEVHLKFLSTILLEHSKELKKKIIMIREFNKGFSSGEWFSQSGPQQNESPPFF